MEAANVDRLRRSFAQPEHWAVQRFGEQRIRAQAMLREHVLRRVDDALAPAGFEALLAKGAALACTVYPEPWMRAMSDVDLLVHPTDATAIVELLVRAGFRHESRGRRRAMDEHNLVLPVGDGAYTVELHTTLDKIVARDIDWRAVFARARRHGEALRLPQNVDQFLLVVLHAAVSDFDHGSCWLDLHLLLGTQLDVDVVVARAACWQLRTALFVAMTALRNAGSDRVPRELVDRSRPSPLRMRMLARNYSLDAFPPHTYGLPMGVPWAMRQLSLRDDPLRWLAGYGRHGAGRLLEKLTKSSRSA